MNRDPKQKVDVYCMPLKDADSLESRMSDAELANFLPVQVSIEQWVKLDHSGLLEIPELPAHNLWNSLLLFSGYVLNLF